MMRLKFNSLAPVVIFAVGVFCSWLFYSSEYEQQELALDAELKIFAQHQVTLLQLELARNTEVLGALQVFLKLETPTREEFSNYTSDFLKKHPSIQALEWVPRVEHFERNEFEQRQREFYSDFTIKEQAGDVGRGLGWMVPAYDRAVYYPVAYVEPFELNQIALGYDLGSSAERLAAIEVAIGDEAVVVTAPITLVQEQEQQKGFLIFDPVFSNGQEAATSRFRGFALGVFRAKDIFTEVLQRQGERTRFFESQLVDRTDSEPVLLVHDQPSNGQKGLMAYQIVSPLSFAGRQWELRLCPTPEFVGIYQQRMRPAIFLGFGLLITLLLSGGAYHILRNQYALKCEVEDRKIIEKHLKSAQKNLEAAKERAELASQTKSNFLAIMSHELRTPMNGVLGMAQLLQLSELKEDQQDCCKVIIESGNALVGILNQILDLSKLEAQKQAVTYAPFSMEDLLDSTMSLFAGSAKAKNLFLRLDSNVPKHQQLVGDAELLRRIFTNLIGNAIKFTDAGGVTIYLNASEQNNKLVVEFSFTDTGAGIDVTKQQHIFEAFSQVDESSTRISQGTGLGLAIVKQLVELLGGKISVQSKLGEGSSFVFTLAFDIHQSPQGQLKTQVEQFAEEPSNDAFKLLLVEDDHVNQDVISRMFSFCNIEAEVANNGREAVDAACAKEYDLILMDVLMPVMDGLEATRQIRNKSMNRKTPIVGISAKAAQRDRVTCFDAGMDGFISKPIDYSEFQKTIAEFRNKVPPERGRSA